MSYDPFDKEQSKEDARREALVQSSEQSRDICKLMGEEWGRRLMWSWLEWAGVFRLSYAGDSLAQASFNEGTRNVGLMLMASVMQHAPEQWAVMQAEAIKAKEQSEAREGA